MFKFFSKSKPQTDFDRVRKLISIATESGVAEVEIETDGVRVLVRQYVPPGTPAVSPTPVSVISETIPVATSALDQVHPPESAEASPEAEPVQGTPILSPTPGTFYAKPAPDADPFVQVGDQVRIGQTVCIIEAMKLMNEVEAEVSGTVLEILVSDGDAVEYDQPLLMVETA